MDIAQRYETLRETSEAAMQRYETLREAGEAAKIPSS
jgi:hypothetical protein